MKFSFSSSRVYPDNCHLWNSVDTVRIELWVPSYIDSALVNDLIEVELIKKKIPFLPYARFTEETSLIFSYQRKPGLSSAFLFKSTLYGRINKIQWDITSKKEDGLYRLFFDTYGKTGRHFLLSYYGTNTSNSQILELKKYIRESVEAFVLERKRWKELCEEEVVVFKDIPSTNSYYDSIRIDSVFVNRKQIKKEAFGKYKFDIVYVKNRKLAQIVNNKPFIALKNSEGLTVLEKSKGYRDQFSSLNYTIIESPLRYDYNRKYQILIINKEFTKQVVEVHFSHKGKKYSW